MQPILDQLKPVIVLKSLGQMRDSKNRILERDFSVYIEANIISTDDVISDKRSSWFFANLKVTKKSTQLHLISSRQDMNEQWWAKPVKIYKEFRSGQARAAARKIEDRVSHLIAPHHRGEISFYQYGREMSREILNHLVVMEVLNS